MPQKSTHFAVNNYVRGIIPVTCHVMLNNLYRYHLFGGKFLDPKAHIFNFTRYGRITLQST